MLSKSVLELECSEEVGVSGSSYSPDKAVDVDSLVKAEPRKD